MHGAIRLLYRDLPHPPSTNMGKGYQFRSADGSGNSRLEPDMGKSGTPYSRSCSSTANISNSELPDPGLIFDLLIKRDEVCLFRVVYSEQIHQNNTVLWQFIPHPAGLSGLFVNYAVSNV